jgi:shikimate kinase
VPSPEARSIALIGLRGAGKSTLGRLLAAALERPFVDLDEALAHLALEREALAAHANAGDVLSSLGEPRFRELEHAALAQQLSQPRPSVIATGGGAVEWESNRELLRRKCRTVWLRGTPEQLSARVEADPTSRPALIAGGSLAEARALLERRAAWYQNVAHLELDSGSLTPAVALVRLLELLSAKP